MSSESLLKLAKEIRSCRICVDHPVDKPLPHAPNPVCVLSKTARIAICGQAPGNLVNQTGIPFNDPSGDRLRDWLGVDRQTFYDPKCFAIVPMGFCFPGNDAKGGDLPPRKECALKWHSRVFASMPQLRLKLLVGGSAQNWHLGERARASVTETVFNWREYLDEPASADDASHLPLPHPSWRNSGWIRKNPWLGSALLPELR